MTNEKEPRPLDGTSERDHAPPSRHVEDTDQLGLVAGDDEAPTVRREGDGGDLATGEPLRQRPTGAQIVDARASTASGREPVSVSNSRTHLRSNSHPSSTAPWISVSNASIERADVRASSTTAASASERASSRAPR